MDTSMIPMGASALTDENGVANLPELAPGVYGVAATINGIASTVFIGFDVSGKKEGVTRFSLDLTEQVRRIEARPTLSDVKTFEGTVRDVSGAVLPGASIVVVKKGSQARDVALTGKADSQGHFSGQLTEGFYIAVFFFPAFRPAIVPFQVTKTGSSEFPVILSPSSCP